MIIKSHWANPVLTERFTLTESVESFLHLCHVDVDLLLYEVLDERTVQRILQRRKTQHRGRVEEKVLLWLWLRLWWWLWTALFLLPSAWAAFYSGAAPTAWGRTMNAATRQRRHAGHRTAAAWGLTARTRHVRKHRINIKTNITKKYVFNSQVGSN